MPGDRRVLLANSIYHLTNDGGVTILAGQIAVLQTVAVFGGLGPLEVGILGGSALVVTAIFQFIFGVMSDRRDPSRFLPIGIVILGIGSFLVTLASSFWTLLAFIALSRIGASFYHPVGISWIGREFEGPALDRSMGFQSAFGDAGVILGMASGAVLAVAFSWQSPFLLWGAINLAAAAIGLTIVRGRSSAPLAAASSVTEYARILRDTRLWLLPLALGGAVFNIFSYFGPLLLTSRFSIAKDVAGVAVALWILAGSIAAFFFGRVSRRFGRFRVLVASYAAIGIAGLVGGFVENLWVVLVVLWTLGSGLFLTYPAIFSFVSESSHRRLQGAAFGLIFAFQLLGGAIGLFLAGALADVYGSSPAAQASIPFVLGGLFGVMGFVALWLTRSRVANARKGSSSPISPL
ncbi:MAG TPA: MFS transporter [Thermoplasmata archaeon]|nr:MFS transporter [Thermoplasmata archaeon]